MTLPPAEHLQREPTSVQKLHKSPARTWPIYVMLAIVVGTGLWQAWEMVR